MFKLREYTLKGENYPNMDVVFISDLHKKKIKRNSRLFEIIRSVKPEIILFGGDMISRSSTDFSSLERVCEECVKIAPVYAIAGNHEMSLREDMKPKLENYINNMGIKYLCNESAELYEGVYLTGLTLRYNVYKDSEDSYRNLAKYGIDELREDAGELKSGFNLVMAHNPNFLDTYAEWGADVVVSGHVHGGVVRIGNRGILSPERKFFPKYSLGLYEKGKTKMVVSAGIGKLRINNPAEVVVLKIRN